MRHPSGPDRDGAGDAGGEPPTPGASEGRAGVDGSPRVRPIRLTGTTYATLAVAVLAVYAIFAVLAALAG